MAPATTSVPRAIASVTGLVTAAPRFAFSVRRLLWAPLRFDALFAVLRLRDAFARFEGVFVARNAVFTSVRPRSLPPPALARDLDGVVLAGVLLRVAAVLDTIFPEAVFFFLEATVFFAASRPRALPPPALARDLDAVVFAGVLLRVDAVLDAAFFETADFLFIVAAVFFAAGRPRPLIPPPNLEAVVFDDLAIHNSLSWIACARRAPAVSSKARARRVRLGGSEQPRSTVR